MVKGENTYAIALTFSEKIENMFDRLRTDYQQDIEYTIVPHITLVYPFAPVFTLFQVNEQLEKVAKRTRQFSIILNGIKFFENGNRVAYAALQYTRPVKKLHTDIVKSLDGLIKELRTDEKYNPERLIPHVTIGGKIPANKFPGIKKRFSRIKLHYEDDITFFSLFIVEKGSWNRTRVFNLAV
ncbi:MAG: 2'-5' RNA ligase family protein [Dehalococcoidales bacterium]